MKGKHCRYYENLKNHNQFKKRRTWFLLSAPSEIAQTIARSRERQRLPIRKNSTETPGDCQIALYFSSKLTYEQFRTTFMMEIVASERWPISSQNVRLFDYWNLNRIFGSTDVEGEVGVRRCRRMCIRRDEQADNLSSWNSFQRRRRFSFPKNEDTTQLRSIQCDRCLKSSNTIFE